MESIITKVKRDVFSFTSGILSLENNSEVFLVDLSNTEFKGAYGYFDEKNLKIYVNSYNLDERKSKQYSASVISFFQPYAFYLEKTEEGELLRKGTEGKLERLKEAQEIFTGIGKWVEMMTLKYLEDANYVFDYELKMANEKYKSLEGFKVCQELWENSKKLNIETFDLSGNFIEPERVQKKIIRILIKNLGKESNPNLFLKNLTKKFLGYEEILYLYLNSGEYAFRKPKDIMEIEECYKKIKTALAFNSIFRDYKLAWKPLNKSLKNFGLTDLYERSLKLFEFFSKNLAIDERLSELEEEERKRLENDLRELLTEIECMLGSYEKEKPILISL